MNSPVTLTVQILSSCNNDFLASVSEVNFTGYQVLSLF